MTPIHHDKMPDNIPLALEVSHLKRPPVYVGIDSNRDLILARHCPPAVLDMFMPVVTIWFHPTLIHPPIHIPFSPYPHAILSYHSLNPYLILLIEAGIGQLAMDVSWPVCFSPYLHIPSFLLTWPIMVAQVHVTYRHIRSIPSHVMYHQGPSALV